MFFIYIFTQLLIKYKDYLSIIFGLALQAERATANARARGAPGRSTTSSSAAARAAQQQVEQKQATNSKQQQEQVNNFATVIIIISDVVVFAYLLSP